VSRPRSSLPPAEDSLRQKLVSIGFVAALLILTLIAIASYQSINELRERASLVEHAQQVRIDIEELLALYSDARISWRNFLSRGSGNPEEYEARANAVVQKIQSLKRSIGNDFAQQTRLAKFSALMDRELDIMRESIRRRAAGVLREPAEILQELIGDQLNISELTGLAREMKAEQESLLVARGRQSDKSAAQTVLFIVLGSIVSVAMLVIAFGLLRRDITERARADKKLRRSEELFRLMVENVIDYAIFLLDPKGLIVSWNAGAERIKGYRAEEIIGQHFRIFYPPDAEPGYPESELRMAAARGRFEDEGWRLRKDGSRFWANVVITALRDEQGNLRGFSKITRDLSERKRQEERLKQSEERSRLLIEGVKDYGIFMLDPQGRVSSWNAGAERIKGYKAEDIIGESFSRFYTEEDLASGKPERELELARNQGSTKDEGWRMRKDGSRFWAQVVITSLYDQHGTLRGFAKVIRDASEQKRIAVLEEEGRHIQEFLAMLAHELRNPLAPIRNAATIMNSTAVTASQLSWCREVIDRQVAHLARLVEDLLDVSRITTGKIKVDKEPLDINFVLTRAIESSRAMLEAKQQSLEVSITKEPMRVLGDVTRLEQVILNLLNNATKYTPEGGRIRVSAETEDAHAVIRVRDNGIGMPHKLLGKVFDLFMQGDRALDRSEGGLGIGLSLVRRIVFLHGGKVEAASAGVDQGSEFTVWLPLLRQEQGEQAAAIEQDQKPTNESIRRVLVVDDNRDSAESLAMLLRLLGHEVTTALDGPAALSFIDQHRPEILLLDIGLPGMNGYEVAKKIRSSAALDHILLIAMTGYGQEKDRHRAMEAGFDDHVVKPVAVSTLTEIISRTPVRRPA
jgi:PAS domain S-box-containing protein